jgi:hypothetical protein
VARENLCHAIEGVTFAVRAEVELGFEIMKQDGSSFGVKVDRSPSKPLVTILTCHHVKDAICSFVPSNALLTNFRQFHAHLHRPLFRFAIHPVHLACRIKPAEQALDAVDLLERRGADGVEMLRVFANEDRLELGRHRAVRALQSVHAGFDLGGSKEDNPLEYRL